MLERGVKFFTHGGQYSMSSTGLTVYTKHLKIAQQVRKLARVAEKNIKAAGAVDIKFPAMLEPDGLGTLPLEEKTL